MIKREFVILVVLVEYKPVAQRILRVVSSPHFHQDVRWENNRTGFQALVFVSSFTSFLGESKRPFFVSQYLLSLIVSNLPLPLKKYPCIKIRH